MLIPWSAMGPSPAPNSNSAGPKRVRRVRVTAAASPSAPSTSPLVGCLFLGTAAAGFVARSPGAKRALQRAASQAFLDFKDPSRAQAAHRSSAGLVAWWAARSPDHEEEELDDVYEAHGFTPKTKPLHHLSRKARTRVRRREHWREYGHK